ARKQGSRRQCGGHYRTHSQPERPRGYARRRRSHFAVEHFELFEIAPMEGKMKAVHAVETYDPATELRLKNREAIIHFDEGLVGFSECKDFVLMENPTLAPFR